MLALILASVVSQGPLSPESSKAFLDAQRNMAEVDDAWRTAKKLGLSPAPKQPRQNSLDPANLVSDAVGYLEQWPYSILDIVGPKDMLLAIPNPRFPPIWLTDYSTSDLADGDKVRLIGLVEVVGTKSYQTVAGSDSTVRVVKFVSKERQDQLKADEAAKFDAAMTRTWVDNTGQHKTLGKFIEFKNERVNIERKPDGKLLAVPMSKLSEADQKWIREEVKRRKSSQSKKALLSTAPAH